MAGWLSYLSSLLVWPLMSWSHTQWSVQICVEFDWVAIVVYNCGVLHNLQSICAHKSMLNTMNISVQSLLLNFLFTFRNGM